MNFALILFLLTALTGVIWLADRLFFAGKRAPESPERNRSEVALQLSLAEALIADRGWTAAETQPCWARARELCERTGDTAALFPILFGQFSTSLSRGAPDMHDLAQQALQLTQGGGDAGLSAVAHAMAGMSNFARGRFWVARVELEIALSLSGAAGRTSTFVAAEHNIAETKMAVILNKNGITAGNRTLAMPRGSTLGNTADQRRKASPR